MIFAEWGFWLSLFLIGYTYAGYPLLLLLFSVVRRPQAKVPPAADQKLPSVSVIIAAFNEEKHIYPRIENLLRQTYTGNIEILVGSDGSTDLTNTRLKQFSHTPACRVFLFEQNRGKASVLNDLVAAATGDIIVFSDANTEFAADNIEKLVAYFHDEQVGGVCGELRIYNPDTTDSENQDSAYWRYERLLKKGASLLRCLPGANGANYAIRRSLWQPIPAATIVDDFLIGCRIVLQGMDFIYAADAIAREEQAPSTENEYRRRIRIGNGNYQALGWLLGDVLRSSWSFRFVFFSHKVLRWFVPHLLLLAFVLNAILAPGSALYSLLLIGQLMGYGLCALIHFSSQRDEWPSIALMLYFLVAMNVGLAQGFLRYLTGGGRAAWERTAR